MGLRRKLDRDSVSYLEPASATALAQTLHTPLPFEPAEAASGLARLAPLAPLQIFGEGKKECKYFQILKVHFHNEGGLGPKHYFQVFFRSPQNIFTCQISRWSDTPFRFFANRYPIFGKYMTGIFFLQYFNTSLPVRTGIIIFGSKLSKN